MDRAAKAAGSYKNFDPDTNADLAKTGITTSPSEQVSPFMSPTNVNNTQESEAVSCRLFPDTLSADAQFLADS